MTASLRATLSRIAIAAICLLTLSATAQQKKPLLPDGYPAKPVRLFVSTTPGGAISAPPNTPEGLEKRFSAEYGRWDAVIRKAGIRLEE